MATAKLRLVNSPHRGDEFVLPPHPAIVGRSASNDVVIPDQSVSRQHVRAEVKNGACVLTDLGSHNGILMHGEALREAVVENGGQFELGDVVIEFLLDEDEPVAPAQSPALLQAEGHEIAEAAERPVYVDDLFGATNKPETGPGEEEQAAVAGARGALKYVGLILLVIAVGALAWALAGRGGTDQNIKPVVLKAGETKVIDLGLRTRINGNRLTLYIDKREIYTAPAEEISDVAVFELDPTGFMATITGIEPGTVDVLITGPGGRKAIVRILVRGALPPPAAEERLTPEQRIGQARLLLAGAEMAERTGHPYQAVQNLREAQGLLRPLQTTETLALRGEVSRALADARKKLDTEFQRLKAQAIVAVHDRDTKGAAIAWNRLRSLVPDENDEMNQKLRIIYNRTLQDLMRGR